MVRAKFVCVENDGNNVKLNVVSGGSPENEQFFKYTPGGQIAMGINNAAAAVQFEVGKEYYVDFAPAE